MYTIFKKGAADKNITSSAGDYLIEAGCTRLYTEDLQHGRQIEGLLIQNPLAG